VAGDVLRNPVAKIGRAFSGEKQVEAAQYRAFLVD
jgi:hypothetical protein